MALIGATMLALGKQKVSAFSRKKDFNPGVLLAANDGYYCRSLIRKQVAGSCSHTYLKSKIQT